MDSRKGFASKPLLFLGLAQLALALAALAYALYPVSDSRTESKNVNGILDEIRSKNSGLEQRSQTLNLPASATLDINTPAALSVSQEKSEKAFAAPSLSGSMMAQTRRGTTQNTNAGQNTNAETGLPQMQQKCPTVTIIGPRSTNAAGPPVKLNARLVNASPNSKQQPANSG